MDVHIWKEKHILKTNAHIYIVAIDGMALSITTNMSKETCSYEKRHIYWKEMHTSTLWRLTAWRSQVRQMCQNRRVCMKRDVYMKKKCTHLYRGDWRHGVLKYDKRVKTDVFSWKETYSKWLHWLSITTLQASRRMKMCQNRRDHMQRDLCKNAKRPM